MIKISILDYDQKFLNKLYLFLMNRYEITCFMNKEDYNQYFDYKDEDLIIIDTDFIEDNVGVLELINKKPVIIYFNKDISIIERLKLYSKRISYIVDKKDGIDKIVKIIDDYANILKDPLRKIEGEIDAT